jgi:hypothetical protein
MAVPCKTERLITSAKGETYSLDRSLLMGDRSLLMGDTIWPRDKAPGDKFPGYPGES